MFNLIVFSLSAILIGVVFGLLLSRPVTRQRMLEVETFWKGVILETNTNWSKFHQSELDKWAEKTKEVVQSTYKNTIEERDRAWERKLNGSKSKPKLPSN